MRHVDERDPDVALDAPSSSTCISCAQLQVERAERLVEQQHLRPVDERARERDALALAARELDRLAAAVALEPHRRQHLLDRAAALGRFDALHAQAVLDVLDHGHVREERVVLEDGVDVALVRRPRRDVLAAELDLAARPAARSRRSSAASSSCPSPTGRAA